MPGSSRLDPPFRAEKITARELARIPDIPWACSIPQTVNGARRLVLQIDGNRIRLTARKDGTAIIDGAYHAVEYVLFWLRS